MSVADLLAQSRAAHGRSFQHRGRIDAHGRLSHQPSLYEAGRAITDALRARVEAQALDPGFHDPAWLDDAAANNGVSHDALVTFFGRYLSPSPSATPSILPLLLNETVH